MRILQKKEWSLFLNKDKSFNGFLFEELVGELLDDQFNGKWDPTPPSWDGGKDFEKSHEDGDGYSWAECKIYGKTISIRVISNTLVMAVNEENVKEILIFSYSRLNDNAIGHLGDFSAATEIKVNVFDDERLELLILRSNRVLTKYFNGIKINPYQITPLSISSFLSNTPHIERVMLNEQEGIRKTRKALFEINSSCLFEIFIVSNQNQTLTIDFKDILKNKELIGLLNFEHLGINSDSNISIDLTEGQVESLKIYFAPSKAGFFNFPQVKASNSTNDEILELGGMQYEVSRIHYPPFIGGRLISLLENDFRAKISANQQTFCLTISGKSGVGKTRFLQECKRLLFRENYSVRHFDCNSSGYKDHTDFVKSFLAQVWRLPYPLSSSDEEISNLIDPSARESFYDKIYNILYQSNNIIDLNSKEQLEILCSLLTKGILKQRLAVIIDNVQHLQEASLSLLQMLYNKLVNAPGQNVILLSFNQEELLFSDAALSFHMHIKESTTRRVDNELFYEIEEFDENQVEQFLNSILKNDDPEDLFTNHYPTLTQLVKENILPRPLDLWQFILAARDENAIFLDDGYFFIQNEIRFIELIKTIQKSTAAIYEYRLHKLSYDKKLIEVLFLLANLGDVNPKVLNHLNHSDEKIQKLIDTGILRYSSNGRIEFYHPSIEKFIVRKLEDRSAFVPSVRKSVSERFFSSGFSMKFPFASFLLNPSPTNEDIIGVMALLKETSQGFPTERLRIVANKIRQYLLYSSTTPASEYIDAVNLICTMSAKEGNKADWLQYMKEFKIHLSSFIPQTKAQAKHYFYIIREICSATSASYQARKTIKELENGIQEMSIKLKNLPRNVYIELYANFLNRQCVCYKNLKMLDDALRVGKQARDLAIECDALGLACLCIVDLGYVYFSHAENRTKMLEYWAQAIKFYNQHKLLILDQIPAMEHVILLIEGCTYGLRKNYRESQKCLDKLVDDCYNSGSLFYLLQGKLTKAIMISRELIEERGRKDNPYNHRNVIQIAQSVEDTAAASKMAEFYRYSLHLQAVIWELMEHFDKAGVCFTGLLKILDSQERENKGTMSFNDEMIVWDAWDFHLSRRSSRDLMPMLNRFEVKNIPKGKRENMGRPFSVFSVGKVNLPLH